MLETEGDATVQWHGVVDHGAPTSTAQREARASGCAATTQAQGSSGNRARGRLCSALNCPCGWHHREVWLRPVAARLSQWGRSESGAPRCRPSWPPASASGGRRLRKCGPSRQLAHRPHLPVLGVTHIPGTGEPYAICLHGTYTHVAPAVGACRLSAALAGNKGDFAR